MTYSIMNWAFLYTNQPLQEPILHQNTIAIHKLYGNHVKIFETEPQIKCCLFCFTGQKPNNFGFQPNIHQNISVLILCLESQMLKSWIRRAKFDIILNLSAAFFFTANWCLVNCDSHILWIVKLFWKGYKTMRND